MQEKDSITLNWAFTSVEAEFGSEDTDFVYVYFQMLNVLLTLSSPLLLRFSIYLKKPPSWKQKNLIFKI